MPDAALQICPVQFSADLLRLRSAARFYRPGALAGHPVGRSSRTPGIGKDMHIGKCALPNKGECFGKVFFRLSRKPHNQIAGNAAARKSLSQQGNFFQKLRRVIFAVHCFQGPVTARLQAQVEVPANLPLFRQAGAEILRNHRRLQGTEPDAHFAALPSDGTDHIRKIRFAREIHPVGCNLNTRNHELTISFRCQPCRLFLGRLYRKAAQSAPCIGNNAIRAEVYTAVLNFQQSSRSAGDSPSRKLFIGKPSERIVMLRFGRSVSGKNRLFQRRHKAFMVSRTENDLPAALFRLFRAQLRITAAYADHRSRILLPEPADHLA